MSEYVGGGSGEIDDVVRACVEARPYPDRAWLGPAQSGAELREKPNGPRSVRGSQVRGRLGMG